ncbi:MAG: VOC family protein [Rhodothermales bacterium]
MPSSQAPVTHTLDIDHLVYAVPDLVRGIDAVERILGVRPRQGGQHPGLGTANALLALGRDVYLEIIGPDPNQPAPSRPRPFGIDRLDGPRLAGWAVKEAHLERRIRFSVPRGYDPGPIMPGSRVRPDGTTLAWRLAVPETFQLPFEGLIPFLIDWQGTAHPATGAPPGGTLLDLRAEHPAPAEPRAALDALGATLAVSRGAVPRLIAVIQTPGGRVELS